MAEFARNRSQGWRHAKLDGHANENLFAMELLTNQSFMRKIEKSVLKTIPKGEPIIDVDGSKHVVSIFGDMTTSKVDLSITWPEGQKVNVSLKKSESGQVWLISVSRFIAAMEFFLGKKIHPEVTAGISLFIGGSNLSNYEKLYAEALKSDSLKNPRIAIQQKRQRRLVSSSIAINHPSIWETTLNFFDTNIELITKLSFAQGLAESKRDHADIIVYNNVTDGESVFAIPEILDAVRMGGENLKIVQGPLNGGSTLYFPTGFLQMHHPQGDNQLQFHHQYKKISRL